MLSAMTDSIPPCTVQQLIMVQHAKAKQPNLELPRAIQTAIPEATDDQKLSVMARVIALQNMLKANPSLGAGTVEPGKPSTINVALLRTAARAPLEKSIFVHEVSFDVTTFNEVLREESLGHGRT
jgi:hypothetical protein